MWLLDGFAWLYNLNRFTGTLLMWFGVLVFTAVVTMNVQSNRGKLWGFMIATAGAVFILVYLESLKLIGADKAIKGVVSNFVVMTLGGLGSGLLAVAISQGPTPEEDKQARGFIRDRLLDALEYAFVYVAICSFTLFAVCLPLNLLGWPPVGEHDLLSLLIVCLGALLGYAIASPPQSLEKLGASGCLRAGGVARAAVTGLRAGAVRAVGLELGGRVGVARFCGVGVFQDPMVPSQRMAQGLNAPC
ncbi:hypothetical protein [Pseudomonas cedrina]|uniref:hypothetical protein n=1 Tax=Pseudomonas cedrina TaxID=651740 RepID=UPI00278AD257|nr:hypothetical protein [Pseudomonas cedrina]MDQ0651954.1 hypothetical protein [Pseudomonas cedrina]